MDDDEIRVLIKRSAESRAALSPVDRAILDVEQRLSFARGNLMIDRPGLTDEAFDAAIADDPTIVLMREVKRLRLAFADIPEKDAT